MHISSENASQAFDLSNTHMLITGAAGGIGAATARLCSQLGASLVLTDLEQNKSALEQLAHSLKGPVAIEGCDVAQRTQVEALVARHAPFTALADTAGICPYDDDWHDRRPRL